MAPTTDYIRHAAKLSRQIYLDAGIGGVAKAPDAEFYKTLAKALEDIATGLEQASKRRD
jgi:thymidine phosphorylase